MNITDTHCHLDVTDFDNDRVDVLDRCHAAGISKIIVPAIESKTWLTLLELCQSNRGLYPALGLHPVFIEQHQADDINKLEKLVFREDDKVSTELEARQVVPGEELKFATSSVAPILTGEDAFKLYDTFGFPLELSIEEAEKINSELAEFFKAEFIETNPMPVKAAMAMKGIIEENFRLPMCEITENSREERSEERRVGKECRSRWSPYH